jgi:aldose 1-epimerase
MQVTILNYGGIIQSIKIPCRGEMREVVLGYKTIQDYEKNPSYLGAIIGRTAGRLDKGLLRLGSTNYDLSNGHDMHLLHGGKKGFHQKLMNGTFENLSSGDQLRLNFIAKYSEDGFPSDVDMEVIYQLNRNNNDLKITMKGHSNEKTYLNLTNHSYFNLSGKNESIGDHFLKIYGDVYTPLDKSGLPERDWQPIIGTAMDFTTLKPIHEALNADENQIQRCKGIDHPFSLLRDNHAQKNVKASTLQAPDQSITLDVYTTQPHLVVYSGNYLSVGDVPSGRSFIDHQGICFETQEKPNLVNTHPELCHFTGPGMPYHEEIKYSFHCSLFEQQ